MNDRDPEIECSRSTDERIYRLLERIGWVLEIPVNRSRMRSGKDISDHLSSDPMTRFCANAELMGIFVQPVQLVSLDEIIGFLNEQHSVFVARGDGTFVTVDAVVGRRFETTVISDHVVNQRSSRRHLRRMFIDDPNARVWVAKRELECDSISSKPENTDHDQVHVSPVRRFLGLLSMERRDIWLVVLFASVAGTLRLATPLAVESLVNVVSWGTFVQPLIVLGLMLLICLGLAGVLSVLQSVVVEMIQRRQFVRIISDLAHRFPRANRASLEGEFPREFANRVFDIMTIQKATAVLLLDGVSIILTTVLGLVLLAFYHPFLLGFDVVLAFAMVSITWLLGRGGVRTAIDESIMKYRVVHWLQDVLASPTVFKIGGGESMAIQRANQLTTDYIKARERQFRVVIRQIVFAISLQVIASTAVLGLGGWLVIDGQLTLGQLVASELVVTVVVGAFAKAGKTLEKFYDLMAGVDKVGHLIDIPVDRRVDLGRLPEGPMSLEWSDLMFQTPAWSSTVRAASVKPGTTFAIGGDDIDGRSSLAKSLAGLELPKHGFVQIGEFDATSIASGTLDKLRSYVGEPEVFHGTIRENIDLGRIGVAQHQVRDALGLVGLSDTVFRLPLGLETQLQSGGFPLIRSHIIRLCIARAIVSEPKVVIVDGLLDYLNRNDREQIFTKLANHKAGWTLVVTTGDDEIVNRCDDHITIRPSNLPIPPSEDS